MKRALECHFIKNIPVESDLVPLREHFTHVKTLLHENHLIRYILQCRMCGQLYFFEFYEVIDWIAGNDPQYSTYIPVDTIEEAEKMNNKSPFELLYVLPRLQDDWGADDIMKTIKWVRQL